MNKSRIVIQIDMVADALAEAAREAEKLTGKTVSLPRSSAPAEVIRIVTGQDLIAGWAAYEDRTSSRSHEGRGIASGRGSNAPSPVPSPPDKQVMTDKEWAQIRTGVKFSPWRYNDDDFDAYLKVERALCRMNWDGKTVRAFRAWLFHWATGRTIPKSALWAERREAMKNRPRTLLLVLLRELRKPSDSKPQSAGGNARADSLSPEDRSRIAREAAQKRWSA